MTSPTVFDALLVGLDFLNGCGSYVNAGQPQAYNGGSSTLVQSLINNLSASDGNFANYGTGTSEGVVAMFNGINDAARG